MAYVVEIRNAFGGGEWAGAALGARWVPACGGTVNQTDGSDEFASTFDSRKEAERIADEIRVALPHGREMDSEEDGCDGYEVRVREVA